MSKKIDYDYVMDQLCHAYDVYEKTYEDMAQEIGRKETEAIRLAQLSVFNVFESIINAAALREEKKNELLN